MTTPQTIDTNLDALRKLCEGACAYDGPNKPIAIATHNCGWVHTSPDIVLPILDELDRLRAAEAASKARVEELERESSRRMCEIERLRLVNADPRAEFAAAGTEVVCGHEWVLGEMGHFCRKCYVSKPKSHVYDAPPPPAAADRGISGRLSRAATALLNNIDEFGTVTDGEFLEDLRAALATAPKAEDVRREAHVTNEWADAATSGLQWLRNIREGISTPADAIENMETHIKAIRALVNRAAQ